MLIRCSPTPMHAQVFKAARALAPSLVLVDDCEEVFISDRTRAAELAGGGEPPSRIRKALLAEVRVEGWGAGARAVAGAVWSAGARRGRAGQLAQQGVGGAVQQC